MDTQQQILTKIEKLENDIFNSTFEILTTFTPSNNPTEDEKIVKLDISYPIYLYVQLKKMDIEFKYIHDQFIKRVDNFVNRFKNIHLLFIKQEQYENINSPKDITFYLFNNEPKYIYLKPIIPSTFTEFEYHYSLNEIYRLIETLKTEITIHVDKVNNKTIDDLKLNVQRLDKLISENIKELNYPIIKPIYKVSPKQNYLNTIFIFYHIVQLLLIGVCFVYLYYKD